MASARKLPSGMWRTQLFVGCDADGKRKYKSFTAATRRESEFLAADYAKNNRNRPIADITLGEAMRRYIDSKQALSPTTILGYESIKRTHFKALQKVKLRDITREAIQREFSNVTTNLTPKTVRNLHGFISAVLDMFLPDFKLSTTLPERERKTCAIPTEKEFATFLESIQGQEIEIPVLLAAAGSLRRSEIAALDDAHVLDSGVYVEHAMVQGTDRVWRLKKPKTGSSERIAPLPPQIIQKIRERGLPKTDPDRISRQFAKAIKAVDIPPFTFHALRHYYASVLHAEGVPDKYIMQFGGWSTDAVLKSVYQQAMRDKTQSESARVTSIFSHMMPTESDTPVQHEMQHESQKSQI
ncbi:MAG: site-specific integrase [Oscillospiraceae bacterium]|nr:site-specific integrase [Oscillospiraceae bacterium]